MSINEKNIAINRKVIKIFDDLLANGNWDATLFLRTVGKRLRQLREEALQLLVNATGSFAYTHDTVSEKEGYIKVFLSLYQMEGNNLQKWHKTLKSLAEHSISRPVYREEDHIQAMIRSKTDVQREAYVKIFVKPDEIINTKITTDRLGNELLILKPNAVKLENIVEFVHCQKCYQFKEEQLQERNMHRGVE